MIPLNLLQNTFETVTCVVKAHKKSEATGKCLDSGLVIDSTSDKLIPVFGWSRCR
jgi:hypothetical protein